MKLFRTLNDVSLQEKKNIVKGYPMWEKEGIRDEEHPLLPIQSH